MEWSFWIDIFTVSLSLSRRGGDQSEIEEAFLMRDEDSQGDDYHQPINISSI